MVVAASTVAGSGSAPTCSPTSATIVGVSRSPSIGISERSASAMARAASRDRTGAAMNRTPDAELCTACPMSSHWRSSQVRRRRIAVTDVGRQIAGGPRIDPRSSRRDESGERWRRRCVEPSGQRSAGPVGFEHHHVAVDRPRRGDRDRRRRRAVTEQRDDRHVRRPQSPVSDSATGDSGTDASVADGSVSTTRTSSAAARVGASALATSTESDWVPIGIGRRDGQGDHDTIDDERLSRWIRSDLGR